LVKELGYWLDYINFEKKLIIEWDERSHYKNNKLKEKDVLRQNAIQKVFPDFQFSRIQENTLLMVENIL
jgi:very-short-patch-repair endonuclease